ncbi:threonine synthase [Salinibacterium sp. SWN167]|uniref:threonine synthase n=1 Tax=Salinibacterium sp. SWN167 TaxID=2792054 RepID=UPI0018CC8318|nr:threonine synthase [Salinibacterium sp. SWN167]MBH0082087.1 threonine synthase [Salinibacterium sp. SWN167]
MQYTSTRGHTLGSYTDVILEGLASDGGLAIPSELPHVDAALLESWRGLSFAELATAVIGLFANDISEDDLSRLCHAAYDPAKFSTPEIIPITKLGDNLTLVGLSEGPTLAFKDIAMQFLGEALDFALEKSGGVLNILGATSGDTGSAAEYAIRGRKRLSAFMLSPLGRMSEFQRAQMYSLQEPNIHNLVVDGVFDDCQELVKELSSDAAFKQAHNLGAMNSINFGRISAQIVYYFWSWLRVTDAVDAHERAGFEISFSVPSGNFGNVLSGHYARMMGLPIRKLVVATNENNVLDEFFRTGIYRPRNAANTLATSSPSMDVSKASNLERFLFDLLGSDAERLRDLWKQLGADGFVDLASQQSRFLEEFGIVSGTSTHQDRVNTIRSVFESTQVLLDPHTADGVTVAQAHIEPGIPMLVLETAKPAKFPDVIAEALGRIPATDEAYREMLELPQHQIDMPADAAALRAYISEHALHAHS